MREGARVPQDRQPDGLATFAFDRIAIVGLGLIGGSVALAVRRAAPAAAVIGIDTKDVVQIARQRGAVTAAAVELDAVSDADLVVLAAPILANVRLLDQLSTRVRRTAVVTDVGSTKRAIVEAARPLAGTLTFVGGHPLAGAASGGIENARADLFAARHWVFTPDGETSGEAVGRLFAFVAGLGAEPLAMSAGNHDRLMAFVSHLPQLTASALMQVVGAEAGEAGLRLAGPGLVDMTRLAESACDIWSDICVTNADEIRAALSRLIDALGDLRTRVEEPDALVDLFSHALAWRARMRASSRTHLPDAGPARQVSSRP